MWTRQWMPGGEPVLDPDVGVGGAADRDAAEQVDALARGEAAAGHGDELGVGGGDPAALDRVHPGPVGRLVDRAASGRGDP